MAKSIRFVLLAVVVGLLALAWDAFFLVREGQQAVIMQFGRPVGKPIVEAGLQLKLPLIQNVRYFERRILIWDGDPNQIPTNDKTFVYLEVTARWRIADPLRFLQAVNNESRAQSLLDDIIDGTVRDLVNKNDLVEIIRSSDWSREAMGGEVTEEIAFGRDRITAMIHEAAAKITPSYGIELLDVLFKRVNYIESVRLKVYERMISERKRIAAEKRSYGEGQKAAILGRLDKELKEIISTANRDAQMIRGEADAEATRIYGEVYSRDPDLYAFLTTLESYRETVAGNSTLVLSPDSEFYQYLKKIR
ncbi:MAG: protease modulator HflC [Thermodesulfobacteriota bacterium]